MFTVKKIPIRFVFLIGISYFWSKLEDMEIFEIKKDNIIFSVLADTEEDANLKILLFYSNLEKRKGIPDNAILSDPVINGNILVKGRIILK